MYASVRGSDKQGGEVRLKFLIETFHLICSIRGVSHEVIYSDFLELVARRSRISLFNTDFLKNKDLKRIMEKMKCLFRIQMRGSYLNN